MTSRPAAGLLLLLTFLQPSRPCYDGHVSKSCCDRGDIYRFFGTKTAYSNAVSFNGSKDEDYAVPGCKPVLLLLVMRHATRFPSEKDMNKSAKRLPELREQILEAERNNCSKLCKRDLKLLREWNWNWKLEHENRVTLSGVKDTKMIAERLQKRLPELLPRTYSTEDYQIKVTSRKRTADTASAFMFELLNKKDFEEVAFTDVDDDVLSFHKACAKLLKEKGVTNAEQVEEKEKFLGGDYFTAMVQSVSNRTGVSLTEDDVILMAKMCAFGTAINGASPFCNLFRKEDLQLLEYAGDLDDYYKDGYGNARNYAQACPMVQELLARIKEHTESQSCNHCQNRRRQLKASLYFTHEGAVKKVLSRFGVNMDKKPLRADDYCKLKDSRRWRGSLLCPFTANFGLVLYRCRRPRYKVAAFVNERRVRLQGCSDDVCNLEEFLKSPAVRNSRSCDLGEICSLDWKGDKC